MDECGPSQVDLDVQLLSLTGRQLDTPKLRDGHLASCLQLSHGALESLLKFFLPLQPVTGNSGMNYPMGQSTNYSNGFAAIHPPEYEAS